MIIVANINYREVNNKGGETQVKMSAPLEAILKLMAWE